jgi:uncharacterized protein (TIGR02246 family)
MPDTEARIAALEQRLQLLEDRLAIMQLMSTYGPAVDSGASEAVASLFTEGGTYDSGVGAWTGRDAIASMVEGEMHRSLMAEGCAHVMAMPMVEVIGDSATAYGYSRLYVRQNDSDSFRVWRVSATRWEFQRAAGRWCVKRRLNRLLDGREDARALFREALASGPGAT